MIRSFAEIDRNVEVEGSERAILHCWFDRSLPAHVNEAGDRVISAGMYRITAGGGQPGTGASGAQQTLTIHGDQKLPE